jgi:formate dehydrogenase maturation protein FdhE
MKEATWDRRARRAKELTSSYPFAAEGLRFYSSLLTFQKRLYEQVEKALSASSRISGDRPLRNELDLFLLLPQFPVFLSLIRKIAPAPLADAASSLEQKGPLGWQHAIEEFWHGDPESASGNEGREQLDIADASEAISSDLSLAWIFLQPYAEYLADHREPTVVDGTPFTCPLCGARPITGVLRIEGDGAKKSLICMLCAHEWTFRRIYCPACGEEREPQMAFYSAPEIAHVRVDVCDTCHTYLKSIDLTKMGLAVPVVDELATMPLDLWAREHGYVKLQTNLLGT